MASKTDAQLLTQANQIETETVDNANSATRIGIMFRDIIDSKPNNTVASLTDWDMDTDAFPASSKKGQRYFGIRTTSTTETTSLVDNQSQPQPPAAETWL